MVGPITHGQTSADRNRGCRDTIGSRAAEWLLATRLGCCLGMGSFDLIDYPGMEYRSRSHEVTGSARASELPVGGPLLSTGA